MVAAQLSGRNQRVQRMRRLARTRDLRRSEGSYVVEGPLLVCQALEAGLGVEQVLVPASAASEPTVIRAEAAGVPCGVVDDPVFEGISSTRSAQPAIAEVAFHDVGLKDLASSGGTLLVLAGLADPGNAGTLVRTAEAFGAAGVVFAGGVDPYNPKVVRAAAGSTFRLPFAVAAGPPDGGDPAGAVVGELAGAGYSCWAAVPAGGTPPAEVPGDRPVALVLGSEPRGLTEATVGLCHGRLSIPTVGSVESLNVAAAGAVALYALGGGGTR